jgi:hypothetical protein
MTAYGACPFSFQGTELSLLGIVALLRLAR